MLKINGLHRDRPTDRRTDTPSYRDARTHLKISLKFHKPIHHTKSTLTGVVIISDDFQSLITRISVLMLFALNLLYIKYSFHSSYQKIFFKIWWFLPHPWSQIIELSGTILLLFETYFQKETFVSFVIQFI